MIAKEMTVNALRSIRMQYRRVEVRQKLRIWAARCVSKFVYNQEESSIQDGKTRNLDRRYLSLRTCQISLQAARPRASYADISC